MQHTSMHVRRHRPMLPSEFSPAVAKKAQELLNDNFLPAEADGYIRDGDVLRVVDTVVWHAMCEMEQTSES